MSNEKLFERAQRSIEEIQAMESATKRLISGMSSYVRAARGMLTGKGVPIEEVQQEYYKLSEELKIFSSTFAKAHKALLWVSGNEDGEVE